MSSNYKKNWKPKRSEKRKKFVIKSLQASTRLFNQKQQPLSRFLSNVVIAPSLVDLWGAPACQCKTPSSYQKTRSQLPTSPRFPAQKKRKKERCRRSTASMMSSHFLDPKNLIVNPLEDPLDPATLFKPQSPQERRGLRLGGISHSKWCPR